MEQITINYDQLDNAALRALTKNQEGYRMIIDALKMENDSLQRQVKELTDKVDGLCGPKESKWDPLGVHTRSESQTKLEL